MSSCLLSLLDHLSLLCGSTGPEGYSLAEVVSWMWQLACALTALAETKSCHMDIKADNVLLQDAGWLVLADFGTGGRAPTKCVTCCLPKSLG